jgi:hypothetical protein
MQDQQRQEMEDLRKIVQEFQALLNSPGWDRLVEYGEGQIAGREGSKVLPVDSLDAMIANATTDAEVSGIRLFLKLPELAIADFESQLDELKEEVKDGESSD